MLSHIQYYNEVRTHLSLDKDAPALRCVQRAGHILCRPILVDCITNMCGFDLRQAQEIRLPAEVITVAGNSSLALAVP
jgi:hypothetical protein